MKILVTTPNLEGKGGVASYYATLKDYYSMNVDYFTIGSRNLSEDRIACACRFIEDNLFFLQNLREGRFDLVHLNPSLKRKAVIRDGIFLYLAKQTGKKVLVFFRGWDKDYESALNGWKLKLFKKVYFKADAMIVLAKEFEAQLRTWGYKGPIYKETTVFDDNYLNGFDHQDKLRAFNKTINLLFLGRIVKEKGIYEALRAYHLVKSRGRDIRFSIVGDGEELLAVMQHVRDKQIEGVEFCGFARGQTKVKLLKSADLFVFPTFYGEGMPNSVLEAMAFGLPVITRPVGGIRDFFENGKMGFITESKDPRIFADYIERLARDRVLRERIGRYNHEYSLEHFSASKVTRRLEKVYQNIIDTRSNVSSGMIHLILSLDYEIFGNGAGDVRRDIIEPTNRLLDICDKYDAKMTLMFEVAEYWAFKQAEQDGKLRMDYSPAGEMEKQAKDALRRGHDVQLHLHPQWIGAEMKNGLWHVNFDWWRIADLPNGLGDKEDRFSIIGALYQGKKTLEDMLRPIKKDYECVTFRAGGFYIQPAKDVVKAMKEVGLVADSSVVRGHRQEEPYPVDFRDAEDKDKFWWTNADDVARRCGKYEGIIELPVYSQMKPYVYNLKFSKLKTTLKRYRLERKDPHSQIRSAPKSVLSEDLVLRNLFSKHPIQFDFCKLSSEDMYRIFVSEVDKQINNGDGSVYPLVGIGHTKDFWNDRNFEEFISKVSSDSEFQSAIYFDTFQGFLKRILA